jgi:hypothetical protein
VTGHLNQPDPADAHTIGDAGVDDDAVRHGAQRLAPRRPPVRPEPANPAPPPQAPPGGRLLPVDEAIKALITG